MSCYVFRVLTTKRGLPRMRRAWIARPGLVGDPLLTRRFAFARIFDEAFAGPILSCALQWEKTFGYRIVPVEVREVGAGLLAEMCDAREANRKIGETA